MFIAALLTIAKTWKQSRCPLTDEQIFHKYNGILLSHKNERIWVNANEMDETRAYFIEWSKSEREKQISYINAYIWNLQRRYWQTYLQGSNGDADIENSLMDMGRGGGRSERVGQMEKVTRKHIHYHM